MSRRVMLGIIFLAQLSCQRTRPDATTPARPVAPIVKFDERTLRSSDIGPCALNSSELTFSHVGSRCGSLEEITAVVTNASGKTLTLDPIQAGLPAIFRYNAETHGWEEVNTWRCANAGLGTIRSLPAAGAIVVSPKDAGVGYAADDRVEVSKGLRPKRGLYVMALRYADAPWKRFRTRPRCALAHSAVFRIN